MSEFVDKASYLEAKENERKAVDNSRRLNEENERLKREARAEAESKLTAQLISRFSKCQPVYEGYDGLTHVDLPDGLGRVQINVSNQEPGKVHVRVWGAAEKNPRDAYDDGFHEDFRCTFDLTDRGVAVDSISFHRRFR